MPIDRNNNSILYSISVDGVLNRVGGQVALEKRLMLRVKKILDDTGAVIVLSTAWRTRSDLKVILIRALKSVGIRGCDIIDQTEQFDPQPRRR